MSLALQRLSAWAVLTGFLVTFGFGATTLGHGGPDDDAACGASIASPSHAQTQFEMVRHGTAPTHCPFCHWQRTVGNGAPLTVDAHFIQLDLLARALPCSSGVPSTTYCDSGVTRGPPAILS